MEQEFGSRTLETLDSGPGLWTSGPEPVEQEFGPRTLETLDSGPGLGLHGLRVPNMSSGAEHESEHACAIMRMSSGPEHEFGSRT